MADKSSSATASRTVHTKCPSGTQSRTDGGIKNTCSRSPPMNLAPMPARLPRASDSTPFPDSLRHKQQRGSSEVALAADEHQLREGDLLRRLLRQRGAGVSARSDDALAGGPERASRESLRDASFGASGRC